MNLKSSLSYPPRMTVPMNRMTGAKAWVSAVLETAPEPLQDRMISTLVLALLGPKAAQQVSQFCGKKKRPSATPMCFEVARCPCARQMRDWKEALHQRCFPILMVPDCSLPKTRLLARKAGLRNAMEIVSLETAFATLIIFQAAKRGRGMSSIWEEMVSGYNTLAADADLPLIDIEWKN